MRQKQDGVLLNDITQGTTGHAIPLLECSYMTANGMLAKPAPAAQHTSVRQQRREPTVLASTTQVP